MPFLSESVALAMNSAYSQSGWTKGSYNESTRNNDTCPFRCLLPADLRPLPLHGFQGEPTIRSRSQDSSLNIVSSMAKVGRELHRALPKEHPLFINEVIRNCPIAHRSRDAHLPRMGVLLRKNIKMGIGLTLWRSDSPFPSAALSGIIDRAPHLHNFPITI
jgi:hypothetical protein